MSDQLNTVLRIDAPTDAATSDRFGAALLFCLALALAWAPFWLGGNRPLAWGVNGVVFPALALAFEGAVLFGKRSHAVALAFVGGPAALFFIAIVWVYVQTSLVTPASVAHPIWSLAGEALERPLASSISVNRGESELALTRLLTDASVFWLALQLSRDVRRAHLLLTAIGGIVAAYAAYGLVLAIFFDGVIPFFDAPASVGGVRATFVNRNHFATYAGIGLLTVVALAARGFGEMNRASIARFAMATLAGGVIVAALLGSASRGGVVATGCALAVLMALLARRGLGARLAGAILVATLGLVVGVATYSDGLLLRLSSGGLDSASRLPTYAIVIRSILDNPTLGLGYGAFADAFPLYRDRSIPTVGVWDKAHNTYLEVWQGLGLIFGTALLAALIWLVIRCFAGALYRRRGYAPSTVAAAASTLVGFHALVDFSLQIEAVTLTYMAVLGAGVAQCDSSRRAIGD